VVEGATLLTLQNEGQINMLVSERPYFLFVGTFEPRKNLTALLEAFKQYSDNAENPISLKLVGGKGWGGVDVKKALIQLGLVGQVDVLGNIQDEVLSVLYKHAYALLMPSLYEGFGLPVVEALSFGTPVLVSENSSLSEVAGKAGLTVDPYSVDSIAEGIALLSENKELRAELAKNTLKEASRYSWDRSSDKILSLIDGVATAPVQKG
jgi:glycosyltransferase involved in cell wall biosynthesis